MENSEDGDKRMRGRGDDDGKRLMDDRCPLLCLMVWEERLGVKWRSDWWARRSCWIFACGPVPFSALDSGSPWLARRYPQHTRPFTRPVAGGSAPQMMPEAPTTLANLGSPHGRWLAFSRTLDRPNHPSHLNTLMFIIKRRKVLLIGCPAAITLWCMLSPAHGNATHYDFLSFLTSRLGSSRDLAPQKWRQ